MLQLSRLDGAMAEQINNFELAGPWSEARSQVLRFGPSVRAAKPGLDKINTYRGACNHAASLVRAGYISVTDAADDLHDLAEGSNLIEETTPDFVQSCIAGAIDASTPLLRVETEAPASPTKLTVPPAAITSLNAYDFLAPDIPPREDMLTPWLPVKGLAMAHAPRGIGKTHLALGTAWAVATATEFLTWKAPQPRKVLLLDGEMPAVVLQERLKRVSRNSAAQPPEWDYLKIAAADLQEEGLPDLAVPDAQKFYADLIADRDLVVVDNLSTLCRGLKENDADSWLPVQQWALSLRRAGKSVLFIHHGGKSGQQRGTSKKEDVLDTVISLRRPPDYTANDGARFEVHFEKNRGFYGDEAKPFEAKLVGEEWEITPIKSGDDLGTLKTLKASGMSIRQIEERTGVPRSTIQRKLDGGE